MAPTALPQDVSDSAPLEEEHAHCLIFRSRLGTRYLFDAATTSIHPWPWETNAAGLDALYGASDDELPAAVAAAGLPLDRAAYIRRWRRHAGAFLNASVGPQCQACASASSSPERREPAEIPLVPSHLANLLLFVTEACNLRCKYCIFGGSYADYAPHQSVYMSWEMARQAVDMFLELNDQRAFHSMHRRKINIHFFGGEPLLAGDLIRQVVTYARIHSHRHYDVDCSMTTNLTHLPDDLAAFLVSNQISISVSIDGPPAEHNRYRVDATGAGSFERMWANLAKLRALDPEYYRLRVRSQLTFNGNSDLLAMRDFFDAADGVVPPLAFAGPIRDMATSDFHKLYPYDQTRFAGQYRELIRDYLDRKRRRVPVVEGEFLYALFEEPLQRMYKRVMFHGALPQESYTGTCLPGRRIAVTPDGQLHICERINRHFPIGDIEHGLDRGRCEAVMAQYSAALPACDACWARRVCQFCYAQMASFDRFEFTAARCAEARAGIALLLRLIYTLLEEAPGGLAAGDRLIDRYHLAEALP